MTPSKKQGSFAVKRESYNQKLKLTVVIMSQEEIDRILRSDLSEFDHSIDNKINSIEEITGKLSQKTDFLAQFQLLLQTELGKMKIEPKVEPQPEIFAQPEQVGSKIQEFCAYSQLDEQLESKISPSSFKKQQSANLNENLDKSMEEPSSHPPSPEVTKHTKYDGNKLGEYLNAVRMQVDEFKLLISFLKEEIIGQIQYFKALLLKEIQSSLCGVILAERQKYEHQIVRLQSQIASLKQTNQKALPIINPLADLTFTKLSEQNSLNVTKRLAVYQSSQVKHPHTPIPKDNPKPTNQIVNSQEWKTYRLNFHQKVEPANQKQTESYALPETKALTVGVPPIKNGFGILKIGSKIIYKGMWKEGKFEGSGKLTWDDYCYQGMFSGGCFEGHGKLQFKEMTYVGKFSGNKASGEGTLEIGSKKIMGMWAKNTLVRMF